MRTTLAHSCGSIDPETTWKIVTSGYPGFETVLPGYSRKQRLISALAQTVTQTGKELERIGQHWVGNPLPGAVFCVFFVFFGCTSFG